MDEKVKQILYLIIGIIAFIFLFKFFIYAAIFLLICVGAYTIYVEIKKHKENSKVMEAKYKEK